MRRCTRCRILLDRTEVAREAPVPHRFIVGDAVRVPGPAVETCQTDLIGFVKICQFEVRFAGIERVLRAVGQQTSGIRHTIPFTLVLRVRHAVDPDVVFEHIPVVIVVDTVILPFVNDPVAVIIDPVHGIARAFQVLASDEAERQAPGTLHVRIPEVDHTA